MEMKWDKYNSHFLWKKEAQQRKQNKQPMGQQKKPNSKMSHLNLTLKCYTL